MARNKHTYTPIVTLTLSLEFIKIARVTYWPVFSLPLYGSITFTLGVTRDTYLGLRISI